MKVLMHVNYCEGPGTLDTCFARADRFGYAGIELRWRYQFKDLENQDQYKAKVAGLKQKYPHLELVFGGNVRMQRVEPDVTKADIEEYGRFLAWAHKECGTTLMNAQTGPIVGPENDWRNPGINGSAISTDKDYEDAVKGLRTIGDMAAELGMKIALETHGCYLHDIGASSKKLMDLTAHDAIGINHDQGNIILNTHGEKLQEVFDLLQGKIIYAHVKNAVVVKGQYVPMPLKYGAIDTPKAIAYYRSINLPMICTEVPGVGDKLNAAREDIEYVNWILSELDRE